MNLSIATLSRQALLCAAASLSLFADSAPRLGLEVLGSMPTGSMRSRFTDGTGVGLGVFADWELDAGKTLRLAYDGVLYPNERDLRGLGSHAPTSMLSSDSHRKCHSNALTLNYLFFPDRDNEGFYLQAGLGAMKYDAKREASVRLADNTLLSLSFREDTGVKLACVAGIGYAFNPSWGVSAKYSFITVNNHTLGAAQAGISYRF